MATVYIGLGSNIGDRRKNILNAINVLDKEPDIKVVKKSSSYETEPVGGPPQRDYYNCVIEIKTNIEPLDLLSKIKDIEKDLGREGTDRNFPRIIDLDILIYEDLVLEKENLIIPHPRMHERKFVLEGFNEIAPNVIHPGMDKKIGELYKNIISKT